MHQYDGKRPEVPTLKGECDCCGNPGFLFEVWADGSGEYLCPTCRQRNALSDACLGDLGEMLKATFQVWYAAWGHLDYTRAVHVPSEAGEIAIQAMRAVMEERGILPAALAEAAD